MLMINKDNHKRSAVLNIDFAWPVGRKYKLVEPPEDPLAAINEPYIQQDGPDQFVQQPLKQGRLFLNFADLLKAPDFGKACLRFAHQYGLPDTYAQDGATMTLRRWRMLAELISQSIDGLRRAQEENALPFHGASITEMQVLLLPGTDGRPTLTLQSRTLGDAMRLQLGQSVAGGQTIQACENSGCPNLFVAGGGRGTGARRLHAKFCSGECQKAAKRGAGK